MQRVAFRPVVRALRVPKLPLIARSLVPSGSRTYATTQDAPPPRPKATEPVSTKHAENKQPTPSEYALAQLQKPEVQAVVKNISPEDSELYNSLVQKLSVEGQTDLLALNDIGEFLAEKGVELDLPEHLFNPSEEDQSFDWTGEEVDSNSTSIQGQKEPQFASLMEPHRHLDSRDVLDIAPDRRNPYGGRVIVRNHVSIFQNLNPNASETSSSSSSDSPSTTSDGPTYALPARQVNDLYQSILIARTVKQQTGKGKIIRKFFLVLVGDGNGLVGYGQGKDSNARLALQKARIDAVKNMDWVERFEQRTVWTEMETKLGATKLIIRPRPVGFGLRCNPNLHQILRAAGFKDISAKVWGSRNKLNVIKAAFRMLQAGHAPVGMGDGLGGPGKTLSKGVGMRGQMELERARGRKLISLRK